MRVILWILGQPQTTKSSSAPKQATAVQGEAEAGFFRKSIKSTHSPTANLRILGDNARHCERSEAIHKVDSSVDCRALQARLAMTKRASF